MSADFVTLLLPVPLHRTFDYKVPDELKSKVCLFGRVRAPFGNRTLTGVVTDIKSNSDYDQSKLKHISSIIDYDPLYPEEYIHFIQWAAKYYCYPLGEAMHLAMPAKLRSGHQAAFAPSTCWRITQIGKDLSLDDIKRSPKQRALMNFAQQHELIDKDSRDQLEVSSAIVRACIQKNWLKEEKITQIPSVRATGTINQENKHELNREQQVVVDDVLAEDGFNCHLIEGVTGSGKTEVYLQALEKIIADGKQALVIVPEIGLTPQTIGRFEKRFDTQIVALHSRLNDRERLNAWLMAKHGAAQIVIATRSGIFTPFENLGMIIVDEEHDLSFKQQDSFRYHARDLAVYRARQDNIPIILGSATPSLESLANVQAGRYQHHLLLNRAGDAQLVEHRVLDLKQQPINNGVSLSLEMDMEHHLKQGNQVLLFINRRGYSPVLLCHECGWSPLCVRCDSHFSVFQSRQTLLCHHCTDEFRLPKQCGECGSTQLVGMGHGTERVEQYIQQRFSQYQAVRIDSDSTRKKGEFDKLLNDILNNKYQILIGTQMLAKGHHFPDVTLVAILDVDGALYSSDFRATERLAQLYTQVAGRAGREEKQGHVVLQTHYPDHPLLQTLIDKGYSSFANAALEERELAQMPPYFFQGLLRFQSHQLQDVIQFANECKSIVLATSEPNLQVHGPLPSAIEKVAGRWRFQVTVQHQQRKSLHRALNLALPQIQSHPLARKVRWSLDVDPQESL